MYIKDITSRYVDTESRINSKKQQIEVYTKLLQQAKNVNDVLEVEKERARVQEDLESMITQMNAMQRQLNYSEIRITIINTSRPVNQEDSFGEEIVIAMRESVNNIKEFIYALIRSWFWILLIVLSIIAYKKWKRRSSY